ncbi:MAG: asparagine synthase-related protein [Pseudomonadota bacterium]|nr:asparagine synthase-related protein [Pseudomonadota bacterium]
MNGVSRDVIVAEAARQTVQSLSEWLGNIDGHFAIVAQSPSFFFAAADRIGSCPLLWSLTGDSLFVSDSGPAVEEKLGLGPSSVDHEVASAFALSGYSIADRTIYYGVKLLGPGDYVWMDEHAHGFETYATWRPAEGIDSASYLPAGLNNLHERLFDKLVSSLDGRPVVVPLSAGLDSRFIASGLKQWGHDNVVCVSYGIPGNPEAEVARSVAERLGYEWHFIPYSNRLFRQAYYSNDYAEYVRFSDTLSSIHFVGEYLMMTLLKEAGHLDERAIIINGQSGDFITGNHIPAALLDDDRDPTQRLETIVSALVEKHYKLWSSLKKEPHISRIETMLENEIDHLGGLPDQQRADYGLYEHLEFVNRQSKYVIGSVRTYEYFGHEWRLPLWDVEYLDYWEHAPLSEKAHQSLYKKTLSATNWGGVWSDIEVNPLRISPKWIIPVRFCFKILFAPFGRAAWHRFERRFLDYFMATTCSYAPWRYLDVVNDERRPFNALALYIECYLRDKGVSWNGLPARSMSDR